MVYKILIVGSGGHAINHWRGCINAHGGFEVAGVVDTDTQLLERVHDIWGCPEDAVGVTIDEVVNAGIKADIALICTPIETHHGLVIEAMRNGMHIICEKNMAHSMQAAIEMTRCALEHPKVATVVGHQYPYWRAANWAMRKAIGTGQLGKLNSIQCNFNMGGYWSPEVPTRNGWRRFLDHEYIEDWAVHTLDLFRYYTAMDIIALSADLWRPTWSRRYGTTSISLQMKLASPEEYEGKEPLIWSEETERAHHLWQNGKIPSSWVRGAYFSQAEGMGMFDKGEHWMIMGNKGSLEFIEGGVEKKPPEIRLQTHDYDVDVIPSYDLIPKKDVKWTKSNLQPFKNDLECGPAKQWKGDNTQDEFDSGAFILEEMKQAIESENKIKPLRCFENCIKTFTITMAAIESSNHGGAPVFLPKMWEISRK